MFHVKHSQKGTHIMPTIHHNKIVRDKIPEIIQSTGGTPNLRRLTTDESITALETKLQEELNEYLADHSLEELADLTEVIRGILHHKNLTWNDLETVRQQKYADRGGFEGGTYLVSVEKE